MKSRFPSPGPRPSPARALALLVGIAVTGAVALAEDPPRAEALLPLAEAVAPWERVAVASGAASRVETRWGPSEVVGSCVGTYLTRPREGPAFQLTVHVYVGRDAAHAERRFRHRADVVREGARPEAILDEPFGPTSLCLTSAPNVVEALFLHRRCLVHLVDRVEGTYRLDGLRRMHGLVVARIDAADPAPAPAEASPEAAPPPAELVSPLVVERERDRLEIEAGGAVPFALGVRNAGEAPVQDVTMQVQSLEEDVVLVARAPHESGERALVVTFRALAAGETAWILPFFVRGRAAGASTLVVTGRAGDGTNVPRTTVDVVVRPPPEPVPTTLEAEAAARDAVEATFAGTAVLIDVWMTTGGRFRPGACAPVEDVVRPLAAEVFVIRPRDARWRETAIGWRELREGERRRYALLNGAAGHAEEGAPSRGRGSGLAARATAVADALGRMFAEVESLTAADGENAVRALGLQACIPILGVIGHQGGHYLRLRRDRLELEAALERQLGMECGTLERAGRPDVRGFVGTMSDGRTYFVPLGED